MTFDQIPSGTAVFLDANALIYHFTGAAAYGAACTRLIERTEQGDLSGYASAAVISDMAHRMMTIEAMQRLGWPITGLAARLRSHRSEIARLTIFQQAVEEIPKLGIQVLSVTFDTVREAAKLSRQHELLAGDALVVAVMEHEGLTNLASNDRDFDRVPWIARYAPA
jgi:predicted nucleic acid-binding protein